MKIFDALARLSSLFFFHLYGFYSFNDIQNFSNKTMYFVVASEVYITPKVNSLG